MRNASAPLRSASRAALFGLASILASTVCARSSASLVATFDIGIGSNTSFLQIDFESGNSYLYVAHWDDPMTGEDLFELAAAAQPGYFDFEVVTFPFGDSLLGLSIGVDSNSGFGTPPRFLDYWHYWTRESGDDTWGYASTGFGERVLADGSWDGWVFGSDGPPAPIPAPTVLGPGFVAMLFGSRSQRRRE